MRQVFLALILLSSFLSGQALADKTPECAAKNVGMVHCMEDRMCECKFFPASEMAQTPERFGWDCGINRPTCLDYQDTQSAAPKYDGPSSVIIDKSDGATTGAATTTTH